MKFIIKLIISASLAFSLNTFAKSPTAYEVPITLEKAKIVTVASEVEATKNELPVATNFVDFVVLMFG